MTVEFLLKLSLVNNFFEDELNTAVNLSALLIKNAIKRYSRALELLILQSYAVLIHDDCFSKSLIQHCSSVLYQPPQKFRGDFQTAL